MNKKLIYILFVFSMVLSACGGNQTPIKVGILHATSGTMAISESAVVDATLLAIEEINRDGGVLGRPVEAIIVDTRSDWDFAAKEAERLITEEEVATIFGCWTSACRKTVKPIFESYNHLLFYPVQYEGLELSPNIVYTGATPNQQITPAVKWAFDNIGKSFFLVGSDYVFPRTANKIVKDQVSALGGEILGEEYILLGSQNVSTMIRKIQETQPDVILNTINGDSNIYFFNELNKAGITAEQIPVISFSIAEDELRTLGAAQMAGHYASWNYFQSVEGQQNSVFVQAFKNKYGADRVTDDPMEAAYFGVHLWAQAVEQAGVADATDIRRTIGNQSYFAPEGVVAVDPYTQHIWKSARIGKILPDGQFQIVWESNGAIRPVPYPVYQSQAYWDGFLSELYTGWGDSWVNPGN